jgi:ankyrin repeat protein
VQALLKRGSDPNAKTPDGTPALTVAALSGSPPAVETLLGSGAQAEALDKRGNSSLLSAVRAGREDIVSSLLARGVSADGSAGTPETPLVAAAKAGHPEILKDLLAAHAQVDARDPLGTSALMLIAHTDDTTSLRRRISIRKPEHERAFEVPAERLYQALQRTRTDILCGR